MKLVVRFGAEESILSRFSVLNRKVPLLMVYAIDGTEDGGDAGVWGNSPGEIRLLIT